MDTSNNLSNTVAAVLLSGAAAFHIAVGISSGDTLPYVAGGLFGLAAAFSGAAAADGFIRSSKRDHHIDPAP